jgi:hypothetical protein
MVDMRRHVPRYLNNLTLETLGDVYQGVIATVVETEIKNKFRRGAAQIEPVVIFEDGWWLVPNIRMRRALVEMFGWETEDWVGRCVIVSRERVINEKTGEQTDRWEKRIRCGDACDVDHQKGASWRPRTTT